MVPVSGRDAAICRFVVAIVDKVCALFGRMLLDIGNPVKCFNIGVLRTECEVSVGSCTTTTLVGLGGLQDNIDYLIICINIYSHINTALHAPWLIFY